MASSVIKNEQRIIQKNGVITLDASGRFLIEDIDIAHLISVCIPNDISYVVIPRYHSLGTLCYVKNPDTLEAVTSTPSISYSCLYIRQF